MLVISYCIKIVLFKFSAISKIQTIGRSRLTVSTLDAISTTGLLLKEDLRE